MQERPFRKFANYHIKFAIIEDFSSNTSKPLKEFIYECNKGNNVFLSHQNKKRSITCLRH
ncbi:DUF4180 domain-containing protein [Peribacillus frigoritolerans]|uniref:DUF4180 domain-containing protein n=1 Tax=Peribacillus frigoritolerans TaxID=450367 RepID=UPI003BA281C7